MPKLARIGTIEIALRRTEFVPLQVQSSGIRAIDLKLVRAHRFNVCGVFSFDKLSATSLRTPSWRLL